MDCPYSHFTLLRFSSLFSIYVFRFCTVLLWKQMPPAISLNYWLSLLPCCQCRPMGAPLIRVQAWTVYTVDVSNVYSGKHTVSFLPLQRPPQFFLLIKPCQFSYTWAQTRDAQFGSVSLTNPSNRDLCQFRNSPVLGLKLKSAKYVGPGHSLHIHEAAMSPELWKYL